MSVYPIYLVLGNDGTIGAYAREDVLLGHLRLRWQEGDPARQVWRYDDSERLLVTYRPAPEYLKYTIASVSRRGDYCGTLC